MEYLINLNEGGYYDEHMPYTAVPRDKATVFPTMKKARHQLNRLVGRLGFKRSEIEDK